MPSSKILGGGGGGGANGSQGGGKSTPWLPPEINPAVVCVVFIILVFTYSKFYYACKCTCG